MEGKGLGVIALLAVAWLLLSGKLGGKGMTPTTAPTTQTGKEPLSEQTGTPRELISEVPPADVPTYVLAGDVQYARFNTPIDVGDNFKQWGVTTEGYPVVSTRPPEEYSAYEWMR